MFGYLTLRSYRASAASGESSFHSRHFAEHGKLNVGHVTVISQILVDSTRAALADADDVSESVFFVIIAPATQQETVRIRRRHKYPSFLQPRVPADDAVKESFQHLTPPLPGRKCALCAAKIRSPIHWATWGTTAFPRAQHRSSRLGIPCTTRANWGSTLH